jgi:Methyltransferase domain
MTCKICSTEQTTFARATLLSKYDVRYFNCPRCGFIQTENPYWLDEAYTNVIAPSDVGSVSRAWSLAETTAGHISLLFNANGKFLDYGGGYGLFVRMMRDKGYDFFWHDKYAKNLLAKGFEWRERKSFELVTAFELLEHLYEPLNEIKKILAFSRNLLFTTLIVPTPRPLPNQWPYYALETGQHVSFYSIRSLEIIAEKFNLRLHSTGGYLHLLTQDKISPFRLHVLNSSMAWRLLKRSYARPSLHQADFAKFTEGIYGTRPT